MDKNEYQFNQLSYYTLSHPDVSFIHQHIVDAQSAQTADENSKSISITFALVGLYLYLERNFTGRQVQQAHMKMAKNKKQWSKVSLPSSKGKISVSDVLAVPPGLERDNMITAWCRSVWDAYIDSRSAIVSLVEEYKI